MTRSTLLVALLAAGCRPAAGTPLAGSGAPALSLPVAAPVVTPEAPRVGLAALEREVLRWTNVERLARSLPALEWSEVLALAARRHSAEMASIGYFSHLSPVPGRRTPMERARLAGIRAGSLAVGENIARGPFGEGDARRIVDLWMRSERHRENVLRPRFRYLGVGAVRQGGEIFVTQVFSSAR